MTLDEFRPNARYVIRIRGRLPRRWVDWFDGFCIDEQENGDTTLTGPVADVSALYGVIDRLRDLNLELLEVRQIN